MTVDSIVSLSDPIQMTMYHDIAFLGFLEIEQKDKKLYNERPFLKSEF